LYLMYQLWYQELLQHKNNIVYLLYTNLLYVKHCHYCLNKF
jgi:hypothetical protein